MKSKRIIGLATVVMGFLLACVTAIAFFDWEWGREIFASACHQRGDRCFWWKASPMPVCGRCLGLYTGLFLSCAFSWSGLLRMKRAGTLLLIAVALNAADFGFEWGDVYASANGIRYGAGLFLGFFIPAYALSREDSIPLKQVSNTKA